MCVWMDVRMHVMSVCLVWSRSSAEAEMEQRRSGAEAVWCVVRCGVVYM